MQRNWEHGSKNWEMWWCHNFQFLQLSHCMSFSSKAPKEGTVYFLQFYQPSKAAQSHTSCLDLQNLMWTSSAWIWVCHNDCSLFVSRRYEICINSVSLMCHIKDKDRSHESRPSLPDIRQIKICWHAVWALWLMCKGMRKLYTRCQGGAQRDT